MIVGIDPGWKSFGVSAEDGSIVECYNPSHSSSYSFFLQLLWTDLGAPTLDVDGEKNILFMERFVSYSNVMSDSSEDILMMIGATKLFFEQKGFTVSMLRAIEWKSKLCKWMYRNIGFNNPSQSFDKKFSIAAARALLDAFGKTAVKVKSDHEADAICLSFFYKVV